MLMSNWTCLKCGTHNSFIDNVVSHIQLKKIHAVEDKGDAKWKEYCNRCRTRRK